MPQKNPILEAKRYMQNAVDILSEKAGKGKEMPNYYSDQKYVRMAGNTAWNGCLIALEAVLEVKKTKGKNVRPDFQDYIYALSKIDKKALYFTDSAYELLHKSLGYDGILKADIVKSAMEDGNKIIDWCEKKYNPLLEG